MSLTKETLCSLQELTAQDPGLNVELQAAASAAEVAAILAKAGARKQIEVDQAALTSYLEMLTSAQTSQALSDEQLENVAGGGILLGLGILGGFVVAIGTAAGLLGAMIAGVVSPKKGGD